MQIITFAKAPNVPKAFLTILDDLGLDIATTQIVLDSGDSNCFGGSGETLTDVNGVQDFHLGAAATTDGDEPVFNGTAGDLSAAEYFSFDGTTEKFRAKAQTAFIETLHKNNAVFSVAFVFYRGGGHGADKSLLGTSGSNNGQIGIDLTVTTAELINFAVRTGTTAALDQTSTATINNNAWNFVGVSIDEAAGASGGIMNINGAQETFDATYSSPSASNATYTLEVCAAGNDVFNFASDMRFGCAALWTSARTFEEMNLVRSKIMSRFN